MIDLNNAIEVFTEYRNVTSQCKLYLLNIKGKLKNVNKSDIEKQLHAMTQLNVYLNV